MADALDILRLGLPVLGMLGPGGAAAGAIGSGLAGMAQAQGTKRDAQRAQNAIPSIDPTELAYLSDIRNKRTMYESGMDRLTQQRIRGAEQAGAQTQANIDRVAGGDSGLAIDSLLRSQQGTQTGMSNAASTGDQSAMQLQMAEMPLVQDMADRDYKLKIYERDRLFGESAQQGQAAMNNYMGGIAMLPTLNWDKIAKPNPNYGQISSDLNDYAMGLGAPNSSNVDATAMQPMFPWENNPLPTPTLIGG